MKTMEYRFFLGIKRAALGKSYGRQPMSDAVKLRILELFDKEVPSDDLNHPEIRDQGRAMIWITKAFLACRAESLMGCRKVEGFLDLVGRLKKEMPTKK